MIIKSFQNENRNENVSDKNLKGNHRAAAAHKGKKSSNVIYAGNLNQDLDSIGIKKQQAQKQAMKAILDQFKTDKKGEAGVDKLRELQKNLTADAKLASDQIKNIQTAKQDLKNAYGITDNSAEQQNLDLLEKSMFGDEELTADEQKQLKDMGSLTDYQKNALYFDSMEKIWQQRVDNASNGISGISKSIVSIGIERLKSHPMVDAQKEALGILQEASKEVIGILVNEAKDKEDEKLEDNEEKAQKEQAAKKEEEAKEELAAQKRKAQQGDQASSSGSAANIPAAQSTSADALANNANSQELSNIASDQQKILHEIKDFTKKQIMLDEDIKGIVVDDKA